jgi:ribonuclease HI
LWQLLHNTAILRMTTTAALLFDRVELGGNRRASAETRLSGQQENTAARYDPVITQSGQSANFNTGDALALLISDTRDLPGNIGSNTVEMLHAASGLHLFTDGSYKPDTRRGGWAFVVYRDHAEIASYFGAIEKSGSSASELIALLHAATWITDNAIGEPAAIFCDSIYVVNGCNSWRHIWKNNGWRKVEPNPRRRSRAIANSELWKLIDAKLRENSLVTISWCKGHFGIEGNERANELAGEGVLSNGMAIR